MLQNFKISSTAQCYKISSIAQYYKISSIAQFTKFRLSPIVTKFQNFVHRPVFQNFKISSIARCSKISKFRRKTSHQTQSVYDFRPITTTLLNRIYFVRGWLPAERYSELAKRTERVEALQCLNTVRGFDFVDCIKGKVKVKVHPCTGTEALYRPYGP